MLRGRVLHSERPSFRSPHGRKRSLVTWREFRLVKLASPDCVETQLPDGEVVRCYSTCRLTVASLFKGRDGRVLAGLPRRIAPCLHKSRNAFYLRVRCPWLWKKVMFHRLIAFAYLKHGMVWNTFEKLRPTKLGRKLKRTQQHFYAMDHLRPVPEGKQLVGSHRTRWNCLRSLMILTHRQHVVREAARRDANRRIM